MVQTTSTLDVADNSGAKKIMCIRVLGGTRRKYASLGDVIVVVDQGSDPERQGEEGRHRQGGHRPHQERGLARRMARTSASTRNSAVLVNKDNEPIGTRIFGPVARELRAQAVHEDHLAGSGGSVMHVSARAIRSSSSPARRRASAAACCACSPAKGRVVIERVNMVKRHTKPSQRNPRGGIVEKEGSVESSNVRSWCNKCVAPRRACRQGKRRASKQEARLHQVRHGLRDALDGSRNG